MPLEELIVSIPPHYTKRPLLRIPQDAEGTAQVGD
jgi:hypothetical protein